MGNCFTNRSDEFDLMNCFEKRPESSSHKSINESFSRRSLHPAIEGKKKSKTLVLERKKQKDKIFDFTTLRSLPKVKTEEDLNLIYNVLNKNFLFKNLSQEQQELVVLEMKYFEMPINSVVMEQGAICNYFYIISSGSAEVCKNNKRVNVLVEGDSIGDSALINNIPIQVNITTLEHCYLWGMDRVTFRMTVQAVNSANYDQNKSFIDSVPIFNALNKTQKELLLSSLSIGRYVDEQQIVVEGEPGDLFYIIKEGSVICKSKGIVLRTLGCGEYFGEQAMLYGTPRTATVIAVGDVKCLIISGCELTQALGNQLSQIIYRNSIRMAFEKSSLLSSISSSQADLLINKMKITSWENGARVIKKGTHKNKAMHVVVNGNLSDSSGIT